MVGNTLRILSQASQIFPLFFAALILGSAASNDQFEVARERMVETVRTMSRSVASQSATPHISESVLSALGRVPRHLFVPSRHRDAAYNNHALPIDAGQTISQPYIVALMTELLVVHPGSTVLEVGTGSGYQAAVLAELGVRVHTIEIVPELGEQAASLLKSLGYANIDTRIGDGYLGWEDAAPFDGIIVTAGAPHVPPPLVDQLKPGAVMVIPVDNTSGTQDLLVITKNADETLTEKSIATVRFVPLTR